MTTINFGINNKDERKVKFVQNNDSKSTCVNDYNYFRRLRSIAKESLRRGFDVLQLPNGDVTITELKAITYHYTWAPEKGRFQRAKSGNRLRRSNGEQKTGGEDYIEEDGMTATEPFHSREMTMVNDDSFYDHKDDHFNGRFTKEDVDA